LVLLLTARGAFAVSLVLEGDAPPRCVDQKRLEDDVQARLGRNVSQFVDGPHRIVVEVKRDSSAFVAELTLANAEGGLIGRRRLRIQTDDCNRFREHLVLVLSLALDPNALLTTERNPESALSSKDDVPSVDQTPSEVPTPEPESVEPVSIAPATALQRIRFGSGPRGIVVYPALLPNVKTTRNQPKISLDALPSSLSRSLSERLGEVPQLSVVWEPQGFGDRLHTESALRQIARNQWPKDTPKPVVSGARSAESPDYVLVPVLTEFVLTEGLDYSHADQIHVIVAKGTLTLKLVSWREQRELPSLTVSSTIAYGGSTRQPQDVALATQLVLDDLVAQSVEQLRKFPDFRRRLALDTASENSVTYPKSYALHAGDGYAFVDPNGKLSGFATLRSVEPGRAALSVKSTGEGNQLVEVSEYSPWTASAYVTFGSRLAYQRPTESERTRAETEQKLTSVIGADAELGMAYRVFYQGKSGEDWRGLIDLRWAFIGGVTNGFVYELRSGLGYEFAVLPAVGIAVTPYIEPGILYVPGGIGADEGSTGRLSSLLAGTVSTGIGLEFYRWLGSWSPTIALEAEFVMPWLYEPSAKAFLDDRIPQLHGLFLSLGATYRKGRFDESD
jgi:hypothetical protein